MAGHESAELERVIRAGVSVWLDIQSRDLVESDRFGSYVRRYAVNGAALVLEGAGHRLTDERPDELAAAPLGGEAEARCGAVRLDGSRFFARDLTCVSLADLAEDMNGVARPTQPQALARDERRTCR